MSLRSITTATPEGDWQESAFIDARSKCVLIGFEELKLDNRRVLVTGTHQDDDIGRVAHEIRKWNSRFKVSVVSSPSSLVEMYFDIQNKRIPTVPLLVLAGTTLKTHYGDTAILFQRNNIPHGYSNPFSVLEGLCQKFGTEIRNYNSQENPLEIVKSVYS